MTLWLCRQHPTSPAKVRSVERGRHPSLLPTATRWTDLSSQVSGPVVRRQSTWFWSQPLPLLQPICVRTTPDVSPVTFMTPDHSSLCHHPGFVSLKAPNDSDFLHLTLDDFHSQNVLFNHAIFHSMGVIHRDIKASNVLINKVGS